MAFEPIYNEQSKVLILGTYPSPKSREQQFYYGHPHNRFWKLLAALLDCPIPESVEQKKQMLLTHGVALWDVCGSCSIAGAADATIRDVVPNDIAALLAASNIQAVFCNGAKAYELYQKYCASNLPAYKLPSTSPANASWSLARLVDAWKAELSNYTEN